MENETEMGVNKNFVIKHGLEVDGTLIFADGQTNRVGINTDNPQYDLDVKGTTGLENIVSSGIGTIQKLYSSEAYISDGEITATEVTSQNLEVTDTATLNDIILNGYVSIGNTTGKVNQILVSTGTGVTWSSLSKNSILVTASPGQDSFLFNYEVGTVEIYINGVRLSRDEFTATDGSTITLKDACFGGETVEIIVTSSAPIGTGSETVVSIGLTAQKDGSTVGTASSITIINFIGAGVSLTSPSPNQVDIAIDSIVNPPGKTIYVTINGNDSNDGLTLDYPKRTVKAAAGISSSGDTIKVSPGTYVENNPIILPENVSVEGAELRNCIITPQNPASDLFWVSNGNHLTDLSFHGQTASSNAAVVAFKPLQGTADDRFFDAARMIRYNLDFIAGEAVGYLTSTDYKNPPFTLTSGDYTSCKDDIKDIFKAVCHDITRGGNSKCVGAGLSYFSGTTLQHIVGVKTETIDTIHYAAGIAQSCITNISWNGSYQSDFYQLKDLSIQADSSTGSNQDIDSCANVVSAIYSCVGVVTAIIDQGPSVVGSSFNLMYPGNAGIGTTNPNDVPYQGVGVVTKGPYIRNCTNFIPGSVGMRVDGFHADPGDKDDIGITGMMSVDSFTQYNQGGIGVEISNGAYAQLVSIFTICNDKSIVTKDGGQCDITNSNSSFGTYGLISDGVADSSSLSSYHYTAFVDASAVEGDTSVVLNGVGNERPYSGQVVYFDELYYEISGVTVVDGGSGYTDAPTVVFPIEPTGPSPIAAEAIATVQNGKVVSVNMIGNGRNYKLTDAPTVTFSAPTGVGNTASAMVNLRPLYYKINSATPPVAGISTVTIAQPLNNDVGIGTTAFLARQSLQIVSSHSFEYIGAGNTIEIARPSKGGVTIRDNEVVKLNGGEIVYTSTDQDGNFAIGDDLVVDQATGTIQGKSFERSLLNTVTPFIIALGAK